LVEKVTIVVRGIGNIFDSKEGCPYERVRISSIAKCKSKDKEVISVIIKYTENKNKIKLVVYIDIAFNYIF
jgi:hypothetical protein